MYVHGKLVLRHGAHDVFRCANGADSKSTIIIEIVIDNA